MKMIFKDTDEFYKKLKEAIDANEEIEIITSCEHYSDLPSKLKDIFELNKYKNGSWINVGTGAFVPSSIAIAGINYNALYVFGAAATGGAIGLVAGGPLGGMVGAGLGAAIGAVAAALQSGNYSVEVEIDNLGKLKLKIKPT